MNLPPELAAKLLARQNQLEPCLARLKKAISDPQQINVIIHELRSYQRQLEDYERKEEIEDLTRNMNKSRLLVQATNYDPETKQRIINVVEHFCPHHKGKAASTRWIQYHLLSAGIVDECPEKLQGKPPGSLLKYTRKSDMVKTWKEKGSALFTMLHEMGIPKRTRGLLTFTLDELPYAEGIMEREKIEKEEERLLKARKKKDERLRKQKEPELEDPVQQMIEQTVSEIMGRDNLADLLPEAGIDHFTIPAPLREVDGTEMDIQASKRSVKKKPAKQAEVPRAAAQEEEEEEDEEDNDDEEVSESDEESDKDEAATKSRSQRQKRTTEKAVGKKRAASTTSSSQPPAKKTRGSQRSTAAAGRRRSARK